jgi:hypothetical protein
MTSGSSGASSTPDASTPANDATSSSSGSGSGGMTPPTGPFACTVVLGLLTTGEWYNAGFSTDLGPTLAPTWEGRFKHYGYVYVWADPAGVTRLGEAVWATPITTPCANGSTMPDRVVYQAWSWQLTTLDQWVTPLEASIVTIQAKYPSVKRIDLMTIVRCPMNGWCHPSMPPLGPNTDGNAQLQDCHVPDYVDAAFAKVASNHPTLVAVAPKFETPHCSAAIDGIHLHEQNPAVATEIATWFKTNP